jgi:ABC-type phosphate transport system ATPase subunit
MQGLVSVSRAIPIAAAVGLVATDAQARDTIRYEGEIVEVGSTYDLFNHPRDERSRDHVKDLYGCELGGVAWGRLPHPN